MPLFIFLSFWVLLTKHTYATLSQEDQKRIENILINRTLLIKHYGRFWDQIKKATITEENKFKVTYEVKNVSEEDLIASLFQIFISIRLNVSAIGCTLFSVKIFQPGDIQPRCKNAAKFMAWYTQQFTAKSFYDARLPTNSIEQHSSAKPELTINDIALKIDKVLAELKIMNEEFQKCESNYENFIQKLNTLKHGQGIFTMSNEAPVVIESKYYKNSGKSSYLPPKYQKNEKQIREYHDEIFRNLWHFVGSDAVAIFRYFQVFVGAISLPKEINHLIYPLEMDLELCKMLSNFTVPEGLVSVEAVLDLEINTFLITSYVLESPVPEIISIRKWKLEPQPDKITDYRIAHERYFLA